MIINQNFLRWKNKNYNSIFKLKNNLNNDSNFKFPLIIKKRYSIPWKSSFIIKNNINLRSPIKYLTFGLKNKTGINFSGKRSVKSKGAGKSKRKFRIIDFERVNYKIKFIILRIEYDPNRSANIALICYKNGFLSYILAINGWKKGDIVDYEMTNVGLLKSLKEIPFGTFISSLEEIPYTGSKISRAAGCYCVVLNHYPNNKILIRLPSGEEKLYNENNKAVIGIISNINHKFNKKKKAGNNILLGLKPKVRGVAKNCVDHPSGGGRGKTSKWSTCPNFTRRVLKGLPTRKSISTRILKHRKIRSWK